MKLDKISPTCELDDYINEPYTQNEIPDEDNEFLPDVGIHNWG